MKQLRRTIFVCAVLLAACGSDEYVDAGLQDSTIFFGTADQQCPTATLRNELDDPQVLQAATDCFFEKVDAGIAVVLDVDRATVEGDSIYVRYDFDGQTLLIVEDTRLDTFGAGSVNSQRCADVKPTDWLPEGIDCEPVDHDGFAEAS